MKKSKKYKKKKSKKERDPKCSNATLALDTLEKSSNSMSLEEDDEEMVVVVDSKIGCLLNEPKEIEPIKSMDDHDDYDSELLCHASSSKILQTPDKIAASISITGVTSQICMGKLKGNNTGTPDILLKNFSSNIKSNSKNKPEQRKSSSGSKKHKKRDGSKGDDDTDSEEERWLDAIESGKLEEVDDELKRMKNPRLMTARQRALMEKRSDGSDDATLTIPAEPLLALPSGFKEKVLTEEMLAKKAIKIKRRREQALEKREEDKKKTVDRLLKKQDSKSSSKLSKAKSSRNSVPNLTYINNYEGQSLSLPNGIEFPMQPQVERTPPKPKFCGVNGCTNLKKYSCSKTGIPLCSLQCYKRNLSTRPEMGLAS